jgi:hypothetical protein
MTSSGIYFKSLLKSGIFISKLMQIKFIPQLILHAIDFFQNFHKILFQKISQIYSNCIQLQL